MPTSFELSPPACWISILYLLTLFFAFCLGGPKKACLRVRAPAPPCGPIRLSLGFTWPALGLLMARLATIAYQYGLWLF